MKSTEINESPASLIINQADLISVRHLQKHLLRINRDLDDDVLLFHLTLPSWWVVFALVGLLTLNFITLYFFGLL